MTEWTQLALRDVAGVIRGVTFSGKVARKTPAEGLVPVVRATDFDESGIFEASERVYVPRELAGAAQFLRRHDVLVTMSTGSLTAIGKSCVVRADRDEAVGGFLAVIRSTGSAVLPEWTGLVLTSAAARAYWRDVARGTSIKNLSAGVMGTFSIPVPPVAEQRRIIDVMAGVDALADAVGTEIRAARATYRNALSLLWLGRSGTEAPSQPLSKVMALEVNRVPLDPDHSYRSAGVLAAGQGLIDKGTFLGSETEYTAMNVLRADQVVMRKLTAWEGPITVVPAPFDGFVASNEFPTFTLTAEVLPNWMRHVCRSQRLWDEMKNRVTGSVQRRKRLNPDQLLEVALPIPTRVRQDEVARALDLLDAEIGSFRAELIHLQRFRAALLTALLSQEMDLPGSYDALLDRTA